MSSGPFRGMCSRRCRTSPKYAREMAWIPGRIRSMRGVRERGTPLDYKKTGPGAVPALKWFGVGFGLVFLGVGRPDLDGLEVTPRALEAVLALHAGLHLGHDPQASRRDGLVALDADAILTVVQPFDGRSDPIHARHGQLAVRKADLTALVGLDLVDLVGVGPMLAAGAEQVLERL